MKRVYLQPSSYVEQKGDLVEYVVTMSSSPNSPTILPDLIEATRTYKLRRDNSVVAWITLERRVTAYSTVVLTELIARYYQHTDMEIVRLTANPYGGEPQDYVNC